MDITEIQQILWGSKVSVVVESDEGDQGVAAANLIALAMEDVPKSPRKAGIGALLVMAETVVAQTDTEKGGWKWKGRSEVVWSEKRRERRLAKSQPSFCLVSCLERVFLVQPSLNLVFAVTVFTSKTMRRL